VNALKEVAKNLGLRRRGFQMKSDSETLRLVVSMLRMGSDLDGWILTMEDINS